jgi:hypothetical protein
VHSLHPFCVWLAQTPLSQYIQVREWVVPATQTVHILSVSAVIASALMLNLRLLGVNASHQTLRSVAQRFLPVIWSALVVLLATGAILIIAEPARALENPVFVLKMGLLVVAAGVTLACQIPLSRDTSFWETSRARRLAGKLLAVISVFLWVGIIFSGRWIAYVQTA